MAIVIGKKPSAIPPEISKILGPAPLLSTEDEKVYEMTMASMAKYVKPDDIIAWLIIKDIVDSRFELARYKRVKPALIERIINAEKEREIASLHKRRQMFLDDLGAKRDKDIAETRFLHASDVSIEERILEIEEDYSQSAETFDEMFNEKIAEWEKHSSTDANAAASFFVWAKEHEQVDRLLESAERRFNTAIRDLERHMGGFGQVLKGRVDRIIEGEYVAEDEVEIVDERLPRQ